MPPSPSHSSFSLWCHPPPSLSLSGEQGPTACTGGWRRWWSTTRPLPPPSMDLLATTPPAASSAYDNGARSNRSAAYGRVVALLPDPKVLLWANLSVALLQATRWLSYPAVRHCSTMIAQMRLAPFSSSSHRRRPQVTARSATTATRRSEIYGGSG